ncbi:RecB family exonuclease [Saccharothrix sp. HUAS TT1]|uniref:RecB family exonuclease n=1 Tax=unclassified Saccharothrix TaxID=2593673 RepID=UPI00345B654F
MSQVKDLGILDPDTGCPYSYYLKRVEKKWQRPAAWLPQGLAVHEAAEAWERSDRAMSLDEAQAVYAESYRRHTDAQLEDTPNAEFWFSSGRYRGPEDIARRFSIGLEQVEGYVRYYTEEHPDEEIWAAPDGAKVIELEFNIELGGVQVKGFIDQAIDGKPRDIKTGVNPGDDFQLAVYAAALLLMYGVPMTTGDYWMARLGRPTVPYRLHNWTLESLGQVFQQADERIKAGDFPPRPSPDTCRRCSVAASCRFFSA